MPARDVEFAKSFFSWMRDNAQVLRQARVCAETEAHCVVSKVSGGKGLIYVVNYAPGAREFELTLRTGQSKAPPVRQVYPAAEPARPLADGDVLRVKVRGESTAIYEVNGALRSLPPENRSRFPIDLDLKRQQDLWAARLDMPDVRESLAKAADDSVPRELLSLDQVQDERPDLLVNIQADEHRSIPAVKWIGNGKLPKPFLDVYGFHDGKTVDTWKIVPWALPDRVWLVVRPDKPVPLAGPHPTLKVNGTAVELVPRVDYRFDDVGQWNCPLYYGDVTKAVRFGESNGVEISIPGQEAQPLAYILSAADRK
jgi:hypothetical protein